MGNRRPSGYEQEVDCHAAYWTPTPQYVPGSRRRWRRGLRWMGFRGWFITGIEGGSSNVRGISLPLVRRLLTEVGVMVTDLWKRD